MGARDASTPIAKHQPHLGKGAHTGPAFLTRFLFGPSASSAFGQNLEPPRVLTLAVLGDPVPMDPIPIFPTSGPAPGSH